MKSRLCLIVNPPEHIRQALLGLDPDAESNKIKIEGVPHEHCWYSDTNTAREIYAAAKEQGKQYQFKVAVSCENAGYRFLSENEWVPAINRRRNLGRRVRKNLELARGDKLE